MEIKSAIIPIRAVEHLRSMLMRTTEVKVYLDSTRIIFDMGDAALVSRLIEGEYPDYDQVIPSEDGIKLTIETQRLLSVCKRVATMANPKLPGIKIEAMGDCLKMSSSTPEYGEAYEEMQIRKEGDDVEVALNVRYLMDALTAMSAEEARIERSSAQASADKASKR